MKRSYRAQGLLLKYGADILSSRGMKLEKRFFQHGTVTVYDHSVGVALMCLQLAALLRLRLFPAILAVLAGVLLCGLIMGVVSFGLLEAIGFALP